MTRRALLIGSLLLLTACTKQASGSLEQTLKNPLTAERYWADMTEMYVGMLVDDPSVKDNAKKSADVANRKNDAMKKEQEATALRKKGIVGNFTPIKNEVSGTALLLGQYLYFGSEFFVEPGPNTHVYLTTAVDPRDVSFPDDTSIDLGQLQNPYGAQTYTVPGKTVNANIRTVVLYDQELGRLSAFVQLVPQQ